MMRQWLLATALVASLAPVATAQTVLYRETFGRPDPATGNIGTPLFDWFRFNQAGTLGSATNGVSSDGTGKPTNLANTASAGPHQDDTFNPYAEGWTYMDGSQRLSMTTEYSFNPADAAPVTFRWWQGARDIVDDVDPQEGKLALRVGGVWYVSVQDFTNSNVTGGANFGLEVGGATEKSYTFDPAAANWLTLNFNGDYDPVTNTATASMVALSIGAPAAAPLSGSITGFGFYRDVTGQNFRFDNFTIEGDGPQDGDVDGDDDVDMDDFTVIRNNFQKPVTMRSEGDLVSDMVVDWKDFRQWKNNFPFPSGPAGAAIPEPAGMMMALIGMAAAAALWRRQPDFSLVDLI